MNHSFAVTAKQLKAINEKAHQEKQNRILDIKDKHSTNPNAPELDYTKKAVLKPFMYHTNHSGVRSWRCFVAFGIKGREDPVETLIDVPLKYRRLLLDNPITITGEIGQPRARAPQMIGGYSDDFKNPNASSDSTDSE